MQVIHFVRHGEGFHNIGIVNEDAHLTAAGWKQAHALRKHISSVRPALNVEVIFCIARLQLDQLLLIHSKARVCTQARMRTGGQ